MNVSVLQAPPSAGLAWTTVPTSDKEAEFLSFKLLNKRTRIRLSPQTLDLDVLDSKGTYFVAANSKGWFVAVARNSEGQSSLVFSPLSDLRKAITSSTTEGEENFEPKRNLPISSVPCHLALALNDERLAVGFVDGSVSIYDTTALLSPGTGAVSALHTFPPAGPGPLRQILGNPADLPELLAVRREASSGADGLAVEVIDVRQLKSVGGWRATNGVIPTAINWSTKGKQLAIGLNSGDIVTFNPSSTDSPKMHVPRPACVENSGAASVMWLANQIFYGIYTPSGRTDPDMPQKHVITFFDPKATTASQVELETPYFASPALKPPGAFTVVMRNWDPMKTMIVFADSTSSDIGVVGSISENSAAEQWCNLTLEETSTPSVPLDKDADDTVPLGLEVDLTAENEGVPTPILYVYASDGTVQAWFVTNSKGGRYPGMVSPSAQSQATSAVAPMATVAQVAPSPAASTFSQTPAAAPAFGSTGFGSNDLGFGKPPAPAFGTSGFSGFAQNQNQSKVDANSPQSTSPFGQSAAPSFGQASTFGQSAGGSAFGSSTGQSTFGQRPASGFGAFASQGPSKFGQSGFGSGITPAPPATPSAPAAPVVPSTPAQARSPDPVTVDSPEAEMSDGEIGDDDTFGGLSLGGSKPSSKADTGAVNSMFGVQTPTPAQKTAAPAFTSSSSSFGSSQSSFGAFGNAQASSFLKPASGFGVFAKAAETVQPKTTSAPTPASASAPSPTFGSSGFSKAGSGQPAFGQSAFGSASPSSAFGKPSAFSAAADPAAKPNATSAFSAYAGGSKGFSSFAQGPSVFGQPQQSQTMSAESPAASVASTTPEVSKPPLSSGAPQKSSSVFGMPPTGAAASPFGSSVFGNNASKPSIFGGATKEEATPTKLFGPQSTTPVFSSPGGSTSSFGVSSKVSNVFGGGQFLSQASQNQGTAAVGSTTPEGSPMPASNVGSDPALTTPTPARFKTGSATPFSVFANLPPTPPRPKPTTKGGDADEGESDREDEEDGDGGDDEEDFLSDAPESSDEAEASEDEDAVGEEAEEQETADEEDDDDGEIIDAADGEDSSGKVEPQASEGQGKETTPTVSNTATPQAKVATSNDASAKSTTPAKSPPPLFARPSTTAESSTKSASPAISGKSTPTEPEARAPTIAARTPSPATGTDPKSSSSTPSVIAPKTAASIGSAGTTPVGSPDKEDEATTLPAPKPVTAAQPSAPSLGFGRPSTRPTRSSPLIGSPLSGSIADNKSSGDTASPGVFKARPISPKLPFGVVPTNASKTESTTPILPTAFGTHRQQNSPSPFNPQPGTSSMNTVPSSTPQSKPPVFKTPSLPANAGNAPFIMPSTTPAGSPSLPVNLSGQPSHAVASAPMPSKPTGLPPVPQITRVQEQLNFVSSMQKECHVLCSAMVEEFEQLQKLSQVAAATRNTLGRPSSSAHSRDDLKDRSKWSFGDLEAFGKLIKSIEKDVLAVYEANKELLPVMREIESNLLKAETRKEEIVRFSKAKADPDFAKMLKARTLGPEAAETQTQLRKQIRMMENRVEQLESYLKASKKKLEEQQRGKKSIRPPSLDTINRTYRNIDIAINMQTHHIDELASRVAKLKVDDLDAALYGSTSSSRAGSPGVNKKLSASRRQKVPREENDRERLPVSPSVAASTAAALNAERNALRLKNALFKARKTPLLNKQAVETSSRVPTLESLRKPAGPLAVGSKPWTSSLDLAGEYMHEVEHQRRTRSSKHDKPVKLGRGHQRVPSDVKTFDWGPLPGAKPITSLPSDVLGHKPS